ncbi:2Fe-2S iron-sulfur cluster binding domain-containing protein, partial [bacterium]|nr:2Fe-2S iron-sulfur cluster binding domain-containing protein [bacterium]
ARSIRVRGGTSLLSALADQKIFLPSACGGRGTCALCKCKVTEGAGPLLPTEIPMLNEKERSGHVRLSCQVKVRRDLSVEIPESLFRIREFQAEVDLIRDLTHDIKLIRLVLIDPAEIAFRAGQYIQLESKPYDKVRGKVMRAYSIASPSSETKSVDLMIRLVPEGICTTWVHRHLKQGERVRFIGPMGDFCLREGDGEIILVAGGSGMAPMVSLLAEIRRKQIRRKVTYFFGALARRDLFYLEEMHDFEKNIPEFRFVPALSSPAPEDAWTGETGLITVPLKSYLEKAGTASAQGYLCGSPGMIQASIQVMKSCGIGEERIFFDPFS